MQVKTVSGTVVGDLVRLESLEGHPTQFILNATMGKNYGFKPCKASYISGDYLITKYGVFLTPKDRAEAEELLRRLEEEPEETPPEEDLKLVDRLCWYAGIPHPDNSVGTIREAADCLALKTTV